MQLFHALRLVKLPSKLNKLKKLLSELECLKNGKRRKKAQGYSDKQIDTAIQKGKESGNELSTDNSENQETIIKQEIEKSNEIEQEIIKMLIKILTKYCIFCSRRYKDNELFWI